MENMTTSMFKKDLAIGNLIFLPIFVHASIELSYYICYIS